MQECPPEILLKLAPHVQQRSFQAGDPIVPAGKPLLDIGFVMTGQASMAIAGGGTQVGTLKPGDAFGDDAFVLGGISPVAVTATEAVQTLHVMKPHFEQLYTAYAPVARAVAKSLGGRFVRLAALGGRVAAAAPASAPTSDAPARMSLPGPSPTPASTPGMPGVIPFVDLGTIQLNRELIEMVPSQLIQEHRLLPLELKQNRLVVGMCNPSAIGAAQELRRVLHSVDPEIVAISQDAFFNALSRIGFDVDGRGPVRSGARKNHGKPVYLAEMQKVKDNAQLALGDQVVEMLDRILLEVLDRGASDAHIQPESAGVRVRYRVQGRLLDGEEKIPLSFAAPLIARCKVVAELDISERRVPQEGRIVVQVGKRELNFRIATQITARGEKAVLRLLDPADVMRPIPQIFLDPRAAALVERAVVAPFGAVLVAGPTGNGKTATAYSLLQHRKSSRPDQNICSVEDPVEFVFPGMCQTSTNARANFDYPAAFRSLTRQDPDVIMVGELRDTETASLTVEAALTGHLVLTTLHGSNAAAVLKRLEHLGVERVILSQALSLIIVQRLARRLCEQCVRDDTVAPAVLENLLRHGLVARGSAPKLPRPVGCDACDRTGYRGRVPVVEVLGMNEESRLALGSGMSPKDVMAAAEKAGQCIPFAESVKMLMARRMISPADALMTVSA